MGIILLKIIGVFLILAFALCSLRWLADNFNAWVYEKQFLKRERLREECRKEQERKFKQ